jgi:FkbM family methyltransferase
MQKIKVQYDKVWYDMYASPNDSRTNLVSSRKGTQEGKVCTWQNMVSFLNAEKVFDIGCNYGEFLVTIATEESKIFAFEPNTEVFKCVEHTINDIPFDTSHIELRNIAIGDEEKEMILNIPDSSGNASLDISCVKHKHTVKQQSIMVHDILTYIKDCKNFVMKLDIEGTEYKVLDRIRKNDNFDWYCIMFEFNRFGNVGNELIEEFMDGKQIMGISHNRVELKNNNFFTYKKGNWDKLQGASDIIVCKNIDWRK